MSASHLFAFDSAETEPKILTKLTVVATGATLVEAFCAPTPGIALADR